jgi:hypothetical protein
VPPNYRYPANVTLSIVRDLLLGRRRSFVRDAAELAKGIRRLRIIGTIPPDSDPLLFLINHYSRPAPALRGQGFQAWWIAIGLESAVGREMHWSMTSAWTFPDPLRSRLITPLTEWALARVARMYGFTPMPPMPPRPQDAARRADSVRRILRAARASRPPMAMAPEGMDSPDGRLMRPPPGAGRFIAHLADAGYTFVPVGAYEEEDGFSLNFGRAFLPPKGGTHDPELRDRATADAVMASIAALLPEKLRGIYS